MAEQPTGTVTLVFTDVEGSTRLLDRLGAERYRDALELHRRLLRDAFGRHGGYEVDYEGDAFFYAFGSAGDAVGAAGEGQQALARAEWPEGQPIHVRMGVHTGEPLPAPPKYVGLDVHKAARIMAAGHGGQVLVSAATERLVSVELLPLGEHRLKDLLQPEPLYQLRIEGLPETFPALKTIGNRPTNLPVVATPFIGREQELSEVGDLLRREDVRLVTLTGPGGIGKTRLALQAAADALELVRDGVYFIALAAVRDPRLVVPVIAQTLGVREEPDEPVQRTLERYLEEKQVLLLLDNVEQVVGVAPELGQLLAAAPELRLLVTSREPLRIGGEHLYDVPPLAAPAEDSDVRAVEATDAVQLFVARARAADSSFALSPENAPAVAEIVRQLDGLPLAVELAAARVRALAPEAIVARLESRLRLLTTGARDADERQRTLRAAIQWSYDLLPPDEQALFGRLSVFVGGCRLEDAEAVCDSGGALGTDVFEGIASLVDKSLLRRRADPDGELRYWMLETIREFATDVVADSARAELQEQHARRFAAVAEELDLAARVGAHEGSLERLDAETGNLRAALEWAQEAGDRATAVRLVTALAGYWAARGYVSEGLARMEEAVAGGDIPPRTLIGLCFLRQLAAYDARACLADARRALMALEESGDDAALAQAWHLVGRLQASGLSEHSAGEKALERALEFAERAGLRAEAAEIMGWLMVMAMFGSRPTSEGISLCEAFLRSAGDDPLVRAFASIELAVLRAMRGEFEEARPLLVEGRQIFLDLGRNVWAANTAQEAFYVHMLAGDPAAAEQQLRAGCEALEAMGERGFLSTVAGLRAHALYALGEYDAAEEASHQCERFAASDDFFSQVLWRSARAKVYAQRGEFETALALAREAVALSDDAENENLSIRGDMLSDLGEVLRLSGRPEEAAAAFAKAARRYEAKENLVSLERARREADALAPPARSILS